MQFYYFQVNHLNLKTSLVSISGVILKTNEFTDGLYSKQYLRKEVFNVLDTWFRGSIITLKSTDQVSLKHIIEFSDSLDSEQIVNYRNHD